MSRFTRKEKKRIGNEIDLAFEAIKEFIKEPKKLESLPNESVLLPIDVRTWDRSLQ
jgi:hypothetical protein